MLSSRDTPAGWAIVSSVEFIDAMAPLRLTEDIEAGTSGNDVWIRSRNNAPELLALLDAIPASQRYSWSADGRLCPSGSRLATGRFPNLDWQPFSKWLGVELPTAALPLSSIARVDVKLVAADQNAEPNALITTISVWADWAAAAPAVRLKSLRFAASSRQRVLILGQPMPSIPGTRFMENGGIIVPAGLSWSPAVSPSTIREILGVNSQTYVLWEERGVQLLADELFVAASRSSAAATRDQARQFLHE